MNNGKICISVYAETVGEFLNKITAADKMADIIEIRFDHLSSVDARDLLHKLPAIKARYLFTLRPAIQGGHREIALTERVEFWEKVYSLKNHNFLIDIEADAPILPETKPSSIERIVSYHDFSPGNANVRAAWKTLSAITNDIVKIAVRVEDAVDAVDVWSLTKRAEIDGRGIIPIAMGEAGKWTRILGLAHGAYLTYASLDSGGETAPGQITARDMIDVYRVKKLSEQTDVYGIIAGDTSYSMSPYLHNAAFRSAGLNAVFVPLQVQDLDAFMRRMVMPETREIDLNFRGFAVTNPHKQAIIKYCSRADTTAKAIGAVNTLKFDGDRPAGLNTDAEGFIRPLEKKFGDLSGARVAVVGAGGAARACVFGLKKTEANVTVVARNMERSNALADEFEISYKQFQLNSSQFPVHSFSEFDVVVNTTPLGTRGEQVNQTIATAEQLKNVKLVYDLVYNPSETRLLCEARKAGAHTINGFDMLVAQAGEQFRIWTGLTAPVEEMAAAARKKLDEY